MATDDRADLAARLAGMTATGPAPDPAAVAACAGRLRVAGLSWPPAADALLSAGPRASGPVRLWELGRVEPATLAAAAREEPPGLVVGDCNGDPLVLTPEDALELRDALTGDPLAGPAAPAQLLARLLG